MTHLGAVEGKEEVELAGEEVLAELELGDVRGAEERVVVLLRAADAPHVWSRRRREELVHLV